MSDPRHSVTVVTSRQLDPDEQYDFPARKVIIRVTRLEISSYRVVYRGKRVRQDGSLGADVGDYVMRTGDETEDALRLDSHPAIVRQTVDAWAAVVAGVSREMSADL